MNQSEQQIIGNKSKASAGNDEVKKPVDQRKQLTEAAFAEAAGSLHRLEEIKNMSELAKTDAINAEAEALVTVLSEFFLTYHQELLGCWWTVNKEYTPLIRAFAPFVNRAIGFSQYQKNLARQQEALAAKAEGN